MREFLVQWWRGEDGVGLKSTLKLLVIYFGLMAVLGAGYLAISFALEHSEVRRVLSLVGGLALALGLYRFVEWRREPDVWARRKLKRAEDLIARARGEKLL